MRTQPITIFDSWITFPSIFLKSVSTPTQLKVDVKLFYQHPDKLHGMSMVGLLSTRFGVISNDKTKFKTDFISTTSKTNYNGFDFQLRVSEEKVLLDITIDGTVYPMSTWEIKEIVRSLKSKNKTNKLITTQSVTQLLLNGKMKVKFNVTNSKDHGTLWRIFK